MASDLQKLRELKPIHKRLLAYAHPLREQIFTLLTEHAATVGETTKELGLPREEIPNVSQHVKYLVKLECVVQVDVRKATGAKVYKATKLAQIDAGEWEAIRRDNPIFAEYVMCRAIQLQLDDFVAGYNAGLIGEEDEHFYISRQRRVLDLEGLLEAIEVKVRCQKELDEVERRSDERRGETGSEAIWVTDGLNLHRVPPPPTA